MKRQFLKINSCTNIIVNAKCSGQWWMMVHDQSHIWGAIQLCEQHLEMWNSHNPSVKVHLLEKIDERQANIPQT